MRALAATRRRSNKGRWYVSYAWADENNPQLEEKVDTLCATAQDQGIRIFRDKTTLVRGDLISEFMEKVGEGDRVFVFLSKKYLQSPYCMNEMFEMWRYSRQNKYQFLHQVRFFFVDNTRISKANDWIEHTKFWVIERDELGRAIDEVGWRIAGEKALKRYWLMQKFVGELSNVLELFADVVNSRTLSDFNQRELWEYAFGDMRQQPQATKIQLEREPLQTIS